MSTEVVIGLSAVVIAIRDGEAVALTVRPRDHGQRSPLEGRCASSSPARPASSSASSSSFTRSATRAARRRWPTSAPARRG
jgi:hypothetical protein